MLVIQHPACFKVFIAAEGVTMKTRILESKMHEDPSLKDDSSLNPLIDRRSGEDRRKANNPDFFARGGIERRSGTEPRLGGERG